MRTLDESYLQGTFPCQALPLESQAFIPDQKGWGHCLPRLSHCLLRVLSEATWSLRPRSWLFKQQGRFSTGSQGHIHS